MMFDSIPTLDAFEFGVYWESRRDQYPQKLLQPALMEGVNFNVGGLPPARAWLVEENDGELLLDANVRRLAEKQGMTLAAVAEGSSMARTHLYDILARGKKVRLDVLARIADTFDVEVWRLVKPPRP